MATGPMMYGASNDAGTEATYLSAQLTGPATSGAPTLYIDNRAPNGYGLQGHSRTGVWGTTTDAGNPPEFRAGVFGLYLLEGVPVTVCAVATVAWEGSPGVAVFG
jgi:hypothetical protein